MSLANTPNLADAMHSEFLRSKKWLSRSLVLMGLAYTLSLVTAIRSGEWTQYFAMGVLLLQLVAFLARSASGSNFDAGETIRRAAMFQDGLGIQPSGARIAIVVARLGGNAAPKAPYLGEYYGSAYPIGPLRLLDICHESAFYTWQLAGRVVRFLRFALGTGLLLSFLIPVVALQVGLPTSRAESIGKLSVVFISLWTTGELAKLYLKFAALEKASERIVCESEPLLASSLATEQAIIIASEYNCALSCAGVPIPEWIYGRKKQALDAAVAARRATARAACAGSVAYTDSRSA